VDPRQFKSDEEYIYAEKTAWAFADAAQQILGIVDGAGKTANALRAKEKGEQTDYRIGE